MVQEQIRHVLILLISIDAHCNVDGDYTLRFLPLHGSFPRSPAEGPEGAGRSGGTNSTS